MRSVSSVGVALLLLAAAAVTPAASSELRLTLLRSDQATQQTLRRIRRAGATGVVLTLARGSDTRSAALRARDAGLERYYWIEVGRCAELADAHSEWMASLQGHPEWRRRFPRLRRAAEGEVVKNYPWVPIRYREAFDAHLERPHASCRATAREGRVPEQPPGGAFRLRLREPLLPLDS